VPGIKYVINSEIEQNEFEFANPASIHLFFGEDYTLVKDPPPQPKQNKKKLEIKEEIISNVVKESFVKKYLYNLRYFLVN